MWLLGSTADGRAVRPGLNEVDNPVFPEYISYQLEAIKTEESRAGHRDTVAAKAAKAAAATGGGGGDGGAASPVAGTRKTAKENWAFLRPRLRVLATMNLDWGHLVDVYGTAHRLYDEQPLHSWMIDPDSRFSVVW
eukprot:SAG22_NODE_3066_length_1969_cov_1.256684_2_plen_136_part_00